MMCFMINFLFLGVQFHSHPQILRIAAPLVGGSSGWIATQPAYDIFGGKDFDWSIYMFSLLQSAIKFLMICASVCIYDFGGNDSDWSIG